MSLSIDLTQCQARLQEAGREASAVARRLRGQVPVELYDELMLQLCGVAACANDLKVLLGSLRMIGELEQRPAPVTAETLELHPGADRRGGQECPRSLMLASLHRAGDHSLDDDEEVQAGSLFQGKEAA